jgi:hypothetical protein
MVCDHLHLIIDALSPSSGIWHLASPPHHSIPPRTHHLHSFSHHSIVHSTAAYILSLLPLMSSEDVHHGFADSFHEVSIHPDSRRLHPIFVSSNPAVPRSSSSSQSPPPSSPRSSSLSPPSTLSSRSNSYSSRPERWKWTAEADLQLVRIVREDAVWRAEYGTTMRRWDGIASAFSRSSAVRSANKAPAGQACKAEYDKLCRHLEGREQKEEEDELVVLLRECVAEAGRSKREGDEMKAAQADRQAQIDATHRRLRDHTRQTLSHRRDRPEYLSSSSSSSSFSPSRSSSSSPIHSAPASPAASDAESDASSAEGHPKRQKPSLKIQQEHLEMQREAAKRMEEQMQSLNNTANVQAQQMIRTNDLLERFLNR